MPRALVLSSLLLGLTAAPALADCRGDILLSCPIGKKILQVCHHGAGATYSFGPPGASELEIETPISRLDYRPWPGIGSSIWESVIFTHDGVDYEVWQAIEKLTEEHETGPEWSGGVTVIRGDETLASLSCDTPPDPAALDLLFAAKEDAGQCWDHATLAWKIGDPQGCGAGTP